MKNPILNLIVLVAFVFALCVYLAPEPKNPSPSASEPASPITKTASQPTNTGVNATNGPGLPLTTGENAHAGNDGSIEMTSDDNDPVSKDDPGSALDLIFGKKTEDPNVVPGGKQDGELTPAEAHKEAERRVGHWRGHPVTPQRSGQNDRRVPKGIRFYHLTVDVSKPGKGPNDLGTMLFDRQYLVRTIKTDNLAGHNTVYVTVEATPISRSVNPKFWESYVKVWTADEWRAKMTTAKKPKKAGQTMAYKPERPA